MNGTHSDRNQNRGGSSTIVESPGAELLLDALDKKILGQDFRAMFERDRLQPAVFLLLTHEWGNIGDLAINYNEIVLLERVFPDRKVYPISRSALAANWQRIVATIGPEDLIAVHGGGNMGDLWPHEEQARMAVIRTFRDNRIVSLPQSVHFSSRAQLAESAAEYSRHARLLVSVRDDRSLALANELTGEGGVVRAEDVVTRHVFPFSFRPADDHILFVQRDDIERREDSGIDALREMVAQQGMSVRVSDTTVPRLPFSNSELAAKIVYNKLDELHSSSVVVTDRLHGALFGLVVGRPVIVFENSYGKIGGTLKNLLPDLGDRVRFADGVTTRDLVQTIDAMRALDPTTRTPAEILANANKDFEASLRAFAEK